MPPPSQLATVYATDESVAVEAGSDYATLCPDWQSLAYGTDGAFDSESPWVLTSATVDFEAQGVAANHIIELRKQSGQFRGTTGHLLAVESVDGGSVTLRRIGQDASVGAPPGQTSATDITFQVCTFYPQIEEESFALNRMFAINPAISGRKPSDVYDLRDLRRATVLAVLVSRYMAATRSDKGDWSLKIKRYSAELKEVLARLSVRWAVAGGGEDQSTSLGTMRVSR